MRLPCRESPEWKRALQKSRFYALANTTMTVAGMGLLTALFFMGARPAMRPALLAVGGFFFFQMAPLAIVAGPVLARSPSASRVADMSGSLRLADFVSPLVVSLAVVLAVAYLATQLILWDGVWNQQLLKVAIFAAAQLFLAGTAIRHLVALREAEGPARAEQVQIMEKMLPMFTLLSIGISAYYFGKDILYVFELQMLRPAMMSAFLQLLALLALHYVLRPWPNK